MLIVAVITGVNCGIYGTAILRCWLYQCIMSQC